MMKIELPQVELTNAKITSLWLATMAYHKVNNNYPDDLIMDILREQTRDSLINSVSKHLLKHGTKALDKSNIERLNKVFEKNIFYTACNIVDNILKGNNIPMRE